MTKQQFFKCIDRARHPNFQPIPYLSFELHSLYQTLNESGRHDVTLDQVASMIVGEAHTFAGTWDSSALDDIQKRSRAWHLIEPLPPLGWMVRAKAGRVFFESEIVKL